jgi:hypothetical protein
MENLIEDKLETIYNNDCIFNVNYEGHDKIYNIYVILNVGPKYDFEFKYKIDDMFTFDYNISRIRHIIDVNILKLFLRY